MIAAYPAQSIGNTARKPAISDCVQPKMDLGHLLGIFHSKTLHKYYDGNAVGHVARHFVAVYQQTNTLLGTEAFPIGNQLEIE